MVQQNKTPRQATGKTSDDPEAKVRAGSAVRTDSNLEKVDDKQFPLGKRNFRMMAIAAGLIVLGFLLMLGGSSTETAFNPDIFSTRRVVVGPTISFIGFLFMGYAIIRRPYDTKNDDTNNEK
jgi:hypothetical protein